MSLEKSFQALALLTLLFSVSPAIAQTPPPAMATPRPATATEHTSDALAASAAPITCLPDCGAGFTCMAGTCIDLLRPRLRLEGDNPSLRLDVLMPRSRPAPHRWTTLCKLPCDFQPAPGARYLVDGPSLRRLELPPSALAKDAVIQITSGETWTRVLGYGLTGSGLVVGLFSAAVADKGVSFGHPAGGHSDRKRNGLYLAATAGFAVAVVGLAMLIGDMTTYKIISPGIPDPPPRPGNNRPAQLRRLRSRNR